MSTHPETIGIGGAGNARTNVNRGVEALEPGHPHYETNSGGRGGDGNIGTGQGHYDTTGARDETNLMGRGGAGNVSATGTYGAPVGAHDGHAHTHGDAHTHQKVTVADKVIGSAQVAVGKLTHNPAMVEKGVERKVDGTQHHLPPQAPGSHGTAITEPGHAAELKNRAI